MTIITKELRQLRAAFQRHDRDIMVVGGAVRALLLSERPSDIDLCTDATPDEQRAIYAAEGYKHFPTGVRHGTWTVLLPNRKVVEITTLRAEGMTWTRDWQEDLSRRDLTINAIAMAFNGDIFDPFDGRHDLKQRIVRFVGDPAQRMREDHLRILRFFRFHARIAGDGDYDPPTLDAIVANMAGLAGTARERVWAEIAKIISGPYGIKTLHDIRDLGIAGYIDLPVTAARFDERAMFQTTRDPISLMAAYLGTKPAVIAQATTWRWSVAEREKGGFIANLLTTCPTLTLRQAQTLVSRGVVKCWVIEGLRLLDKREEADALAVWRVPDFPVMGRDLLDFGIVESAEIGQILRDLHHLWERNDFHLSKAALLELVPTVRGHESDLPST